MEFVSARFRDVTGYDSHRFIGNASIAFADLIVRDDWARVHARVHLAVLHRQRVAIQYRIHAAHGVTVLVEDRLTPVTNAAGRVVAIEGVMDLVRVAPETSGAITRAPNRAPRGATGRHPSSG